MEGQDAEAMLRAQAVTQSQAEEQEQQRARAERRERERLESGERRTRTGLFAASLMAHTIINMAVRTETNPQARRMRKQQLNTVWQAFRFQLIRRSTPRGLFGV